MRRVLPLLGIMFLTACVTTAHSPLDFKLEEGNAFDKENFSISEYVEHSQYCFAISERMNTASPAIQEDGYIGCMNTKGYSIEVLPEEEVVIRQQALADHMQNYTPTQTNFFDKNSYDDRRFLNDVQMCRNGASNTKRRSLNSIYTPNLDAAFFGAIITGIQEVGERKRKKQSYIINCMFDKGYVLRDLPEEEKQRRIELLN